MAKCSSKTKTKIRFLFDEPRKNVKIKNDEKRLSANFVFLVLLC